MGVFIDPLLLTIDPIDPQSQVWAQVIEPSDVLKVQSIWATHPVGILETVLIAHMYCNSRLRTFGR